MSTPKYDTRLDFELKDASDYIRPRGKSHRRVLNKKTLENNRLDAPSHREKRPTMRSECPPFRPCPYVACRYHLFLDPTDSNDGIRMNFRGLDPMELPFSCALDVIDEYPEGMTFEQMCTFFGLTRERTRQILGSAMEKLSKFESEEDFMLSTLKDE